MIIDELVNICTVDRDKEVKEKFRNSLVSLGKHQKHCTLHYRDFLNAVQQHDNAWDGTLSGSYNVELENHRTKFEAYAFAFFRSLHALIESIPYIINIAFNYNKKYESKDVNWHSIKSGLKNKKLAVLIQKIDIMRETTEYKSLSDLVNITKHRKLPRIGIEISDKSNIQLRFAVNDIGRCFQEINSDDVSVKRLMEFFHDELMGKALDIIETIPSCFPLKN